MAIPIDKKLYNKVKQEANIVYDKPSAYKSMWIQKEYKNQGGTYKEDGKERKLQRWIDEEWKDIGNKEYPVYRPTKRVTKDTPLTIDEIDPIQAKKQIELKQVIKGDANLPPFKKSLRNDICKYSNPKKVLQNAINYIGKDVIIDISNKHNKKYMIYNPTIEKWIHFGQMGYEDFTYHKDSTRRENYLKRTANIKGDWKDDKYSPNNLSRNLLWEK